MDHFFQDMTPYSPLAVLLFIFIYTLYTLHFPPVNALPKAVGICERSDFPGNLLPASSIVAPSQLSIVPRSKPETQVEAKQAYVEGGRTNVIPLSVGWVWLAIIILGYLMALVLRFGIIEHSQLWARFAFLLCGREIPPRVSEKLRRSAPYCDSFGASPPHLHLLETHVGLHIRHQYLKTSRRDSIQLCFLTLNYHHNLSDRMPHSIYTI